MAMTMSLGYTCRPSAWWLRLCRSAREETPLHETMQKIGIHGGRGSNVNLIWKVSLRSANAASLTGPTMIPIPSWNCTRRLCAMLAFAKLALSGSTWAIALSWVCADRQLLSVHALLFNQEHAFALMLENG